MTTKSTISCSIGTTDPLANLGIEVWLDNAQLYNNDHVTDTQKLEWEFDEDEADHELRFVMKNKTIDHTTVDANGNIVKDASLIVNNVSFDDIELRQIFVDLAEYTHDFNGTQPTTTAKFYGEMGCNGTVSLKFSTPIYLWLLENM
jgi:hypothetical protein